MRIREEKLRTIPLERIRINDFFWNKYTKLVTREIIPYQWRALNDEVEGAEPSHCIENFRVAAGKTEGTFHGWVFQDSDLAKWLETVAYSLSYEKNEELEALADEAIDLIGMAQEENGYLDTYFSILEPGRQFCNLKEGHELYTMGHFMEAAVAYYRVTGKDKLLRIMQKAADLICEVFHTKRYEAAVPGHEEIELALVKMAEATGERKYLEMAHDFVERRGTEPNYLFYESGREDFVDVWHDPNPYEAAYGQSHLPVRDQTTAEGHAVRAVYLYCGMADIAGAYHDEALLAACDRLYRNIVEKRMYLTGGIGSSGTLERFTTDYDLPNDTNYSESCASIGLALFCRRMAQITGDAKYLDTMELVLMNTVLSGIAMDGKSFFYVNPLEVWPANCLPRTDKSHIKPVRQKWFGCACCPPNIARTLASLGEYVAFTGEDGFYLNMFVGGTIQTELSGAPVTIRMETRFPFEGSIRIHITGSEEALPQSDETRQSDATPQSDAMDAMPQSDEMKQSDAMDAAPQSSDAKRDDIHIRIPSYAKKGTFAVKIDGRPAEFSVENGYAVLRGAWSGQTIEAEFAMPAHFVYANPAVRADVGKAAVVKGPLVYCLEQQDNGENLSNLFADPSKPLREEWSDKLLGGVLKITAQGKRLRAEDWNGEKLYGEQPVGWEETELTLVPYCHWGNRNPGEMAVWMKTCGEIG